MHPQGSQWREGPGGVLPLTGLTDKNTVEPPVSGHPRHQKNCLLKRGVHLREVKNVVFVCGGTMHKCPPTGGVHLQEVSISGGSTVWRF